VPDIFERKAEEVAALRDDQQRKAAERSSQ
jgi:hypothetical protein